MASTVRANWTTWVAGSQTDDPRIGVNGGKNNIMRYQFTTGSSGASHIYFKMGYTRLYDGSYIDICWYVGTSATSHTNANKAQGSASNGTVTFDSNHHSFTLDADINLSPSTTYYLWLFPAVTTYGFYSGSRADSDNDLTLSGATKYTVSYNANGGSGAPSAQTKTHGTTLTLSSTKPTKATTTDATYTVSFNANGGSCSTTSLSAKKTTKYTFSKWNTASNGSGTSYNAGASYTANAAATLYAQYTSSTSTASITLPTATRGNGSVTGYKVTFNANGGSCSTSNLTSTRTTSYAFKGWSTSSSATSGSTGAYTPTASTTLYAAWTTSYTNNAITLPTATRGNGSTTGYTITFDANGGSCDKSSLTSTRTVQYAFKGWSTSSSATSGSTGSYTPTAATTLYAAWLPSYTNNAITLPTATRANGSVTGYKVTFDANGGTCSDSSLTSTRTVTYTFKGWNTDSTATSGSTGSYTPTQNLTSYAIWGESYTNNAITLPTPTRSGYTFKGWATSSSETVGTTGSYTPTNAITLYAIWKVNGQSHIEDGNSFAGYGAYIDDDGESFKLYISYVDMVDHWELLS